MDDTAKTKAQLIQELTELRQRVAAQETSTSALTQTQAALKESEARFRQVVEGSIQGIFILRDGKPLFVNQACAEIFGYETPDELLQIENIAQQVAAPHEYDRLRHYARLRIRGEESPTHYMYQGVRKDGALIWVDNILRVIMWDGQPAIQSTVIDITARKQAEDALEARVKQIEAVHAVTTEITHELNIETLLGLITQRAVDVLESASSGAVYLWDEVNEGLITRAGHGRGEWMRELHIGVGEGLVGTVAQRRQGLLVNDYPNSSYVNRTFLERLGPTAVVAEPLLYRDRLVGIIAISNEGTGRPFTEQDCDLLALFAAEAAIAIENARLYAESETQRKRLATLVKVSQRLTRGLDLAAVLTTIAEAAAQVFEGEAGFRLLEGDFLVRKGATPGAVAVMTRQQVRIGESLSGRSAQSGQVLTSTDTALDDRLLPEHRRGIHPEQTGAVICVPVAMEESVLGTLHIYRERGYRFNRNDVAVAMSLADQTAIAITNAKLYEDLRYESINLVQTNAELQREMAARQRTATALETSEARYRSVVEGSLQGIIVHQEGVIRYANPACVQMFGYADPAELLEKSFWETLVAPTAWSELKERAAKRLRGDSVSVHQGWPGLRKDGTRIWVASIGGVISWQDQPAFVSFFTDITARKQAEDALRQAHDELEQRVNERTADLKIANEEVRRFAYIVSHDLRAPLINLKGFAGELRENYDLLGTVLPALLPHLEESQRTELSQAVTEDGPEALGYIEMSVTRMDGLIRGVLNLSRAGQRELHIEPVETEALAQHIAQTLTYQLTQQGARITIEPLPTVNADRIAMEQILGNLLGNAVKYLVPDRPGEIVIRAERDGDATRFEVCDNGRGIAETDVPRVFELFRRVGRQDTPGEGMGLAYVQTLIRRHGGDIGCQSTLGVGTTFTFTILTSSPP